MQAAVPTGQAWRARVKDGDNRKSLAASITLAARKLRRAPSESV